MTGVQIYIPPFLQSYTEKISRDYVSADTIMACLTALVERFPRLKSELFDIDDKLRPSLNIFLNDSRIPPHKLSLKVKDGDKLYIAHVISGG